MSLEEFEEMEVDSNPYLADITAGLLDRGFDRFVAPPVVRND